MQVLISKRTAARAMWKKHEEHMAKMRELLAQVMAHPDSTPEALQIARQIAMVAQAKHEEGLALMREHGYL